ncbi:MAG: hypothetical protein Q7T49_00005 [bacterium]|nr:hypothetical protein [bacterium]
MKTYLITYDLIRPESSPDYTRLFNYIKSHISWAKPMASTWIIKTDMEAVDIVNQIRTVTDSNDKILVIEVTSDWASFNNPNDVVEWMREWIK